LQKTHKILGSGEKSVCIRIKQELLGGTKKLFVIFNCFEQSPQFIAVKMCENSQPYRYKE